MFYKKQDRIWILEREVRNLELAAQIAENNSKLWKEIAQTSSKEQVEINTQLLDLVKRLSAASPAFYYTGLFDFKPLSFFKYEVEPKTKKAPEPVDETPMGDLRRYVEAKERESERDKAKRAEEARQKEIQRIADEKVAAHVANLHKKRKK